MIYYCSNNGIGVNTNFKSPGDFIETLSILSSGDIIYLLPGEYFFNKTIQIKISNITIDVLQLYQTANKNIVVFNFKNIPYICDTYNNDKTFEYNNNGNGINIYGNNIILSNITIKFAAFRGLLNSGNNNHFINIETSYNCDCGHCQRGTNNIIENCVSHHNFDYRLIKNGNISYGFNSDGFADKMHSGNGNTYINCLSYNNGDDGFDFFQRETPINKPTIVKSCQSINNGERFIDMSLNDRLFNDKEFINKYDIYRYPNYGGGNGFKLGGRHNSKPNDYINYHNINIFDSFAYNNIGHGFTQNYNSGNIILHNCCSSNNLTNYNFSYKNSCKLSLIHCMSIPIYNNKINKKYIVEIRDCNNLQIYNDKRKL